MQETQKYHVWQEAMEVSRKLVALCEEFSDAETNVLVWHLRQAIVDVPVSIAMDLQAGRLATMEPVVKLATELELVERIYPAIDADDLQELVQGLIERMRGAGFTEREPEPAVESQDQAEPEAGEVAAAPQVDSMSSPITITSSQD